ncbi:protein SCO1/2 [Geodermatophilus bullaregiensis]|uniref:SCO family protein n=1 Tax=Geodermatophilus bullaregiensis TaxID=1564160 RepID=UPI0019574D8F|nr:SCO family protein [Geodermatophilus bullaregiensis]MBM7807726.1 protein SCO1/2 [Geodermatophilus bullaregiensis]
MIPPARGRLAALLLAVGLAVSACGADGDTASADEGHDHSGGAAASLEGPGDEYAGIDLRDPYQRPSFTLTDTSGAAYDFASATAGRPTLLFFGYTNCPDICPTTMADVALALRDVDPALAEQVQVVFVTTDPAADTPEVLAEYLARFDADLPTRFVGLTGAQDVIDQAQLSAGVPLAEDAGRLHSSLLLLYGADDQAHVAFDAGNTSRDIAGDLDAVASAA